MNDLINHGVGYHYHEPKPGLYIRCYHKCKKWFTPGFMAGWWVANTITFPLEHLQWDHVWPFYYVGDWLDRLGHFQMYLSYIWLLFFVVSVIMGIRYVVTHDKEE